MISSELDTEANRRARKWTPKEHAGRIAWALLSPLFRLSPRPIWGWRRFLLRLTGARIGRGVHLYPNVRITIPWNISIGDNAAVGDGAILYALGAITIGERATISQGVHLCAGTHDYSDRAMPLIKKPITIGTETWICADAFVGPGVTIGDRAIVGARAVVVKGVAEDTIVVGNPARPVRKRADRRDERSAEV